MKVQYLLCVYTLYAEKLGGGRGRRRGWACGGWTLFLWGNSYQKFRCVLSSDPLVQLAVDSSRQILYARSESNTIQVQYTSHSVICAEFTFLDLRVLYPLTLLCVILSTFVLANGVIFAPSPAAGI